MTTISLAATSVLGIWPWQLSNLSFQSPGFLLLLLALPALIGLYVWMQFRRRRYAVRYASVALVRQAVGRGPGVRRHVPAALYLLALSAMIVAMARPQATHPSSITTGTVLLAVDVSGSMASDDVRPTRMEATKRAIRDFIDKQPDGVKVGVVSFSDFGALVAPPTNDHKQVLDAVARLQPQRGTNIGGGLQVALDAIFQEFDLPTPAGAQPFAQGSQSFGGGSRLPQPSPTQAAPAAPAVTPDKAPAATIVLLSDGESNTGPPPDRVAQEAQQAGIKVNTVGIGTPQGTVLHIQGRSVFTRLDEATLKGIADTTGGKYYSASDQGQLKNVYNELARQRQTEDKRSELTYAVTGVALVMALIAGAFSLAWFNRLP